MNVKVQDYTRGNARIGVSGLLLMLLPLMPRQLRLLCARVRCYGNTHFAATRARTLVSYIVYGRARKKQQPPPRAMCLCVYVHHEGIG